MQNTQGEPHAKNAYLAREISCEIDLKKREWR